VSEPRPDLLALLAPVTKMLRGIEDAAAAQAGLTMWQYAILSLVAASPGLNQRAVADRLDYSANRLVADLDELERRRLLRRRPGPDRRANVLEVTAAGTRVMLRVRAEIHRGEDELLAGLGPAQRRTLLSAVRDLAVRSRALRAGAG
jgi:DNA-binding MarR family transcriptional regulator